MDQYATLDATDARWRVHFTRRLRHPVETVWAAITEDEHLEAWFPTTIEGERSEGAPLTFSFRHGEGEPFAGRMLRYEPPRLLELQWGDDEVRIELEPDGDGCTLTLTDALSERGKAARDAAGWHTCLGVLERHLDGDPGQLQDDDSWKEHNDVYVDRFPPEAATIGPPEG